MCLEDSEDSNILSCPGSCTSEINPQFACECGRFLQGCKRLVALGTHLCIIADPEGAQLLVLHDSTTQFPDAGIAKVIAGQIQVRYSIVGAKHSGEMGSSVIADLILACH